MEIQPQWQGTEQHKQASDLSRWLIHLTRSEVDLISILKEGRIEARGAFGVGRSNPVVADRHKSVCLTEIPLHELKRMTANRPWGLVFDKERLRAKFGAQPVWYLADQSPEMRALDTAMRTAASNANSPIWALTPYIDRVSSGPGSPRYDFRWEREWRIRGDFEFGLSDVHIIVAGGGKVPSYLDEVSVGAPWMGPDDDHPTWTGGVTGGWECEVNGMLDRFRQQFATLDNSGAIWDREADQFWSPVKILETEEAMTEAFGYLVPELHEAISKALNVTSSEWCRTYDLNRAGHDEDDSLACVDPILRSTSGSSGTS